MTFEVLFAIAVGLLNGLVLLHLKNSKQEHNRITDKVGKLETDVAALKSNLMTEEHVEILMNKHVELIRKDLHNMGDNMQKIDANVQKIAQNSQSWMNEIKDSIYNLNVKTAVMDEKMTIKNGGKDA